MGVKDSNYQIVYRGEVLDHLIPSQWVFFQRLKSYGGGDLPPRLDTTLS